MNSQEVIDALVSAIQESSRVRLVYRRQADGVTSIHEVAPIDISPGWTERIRNQIYLWAWCFAENKAEMHLLDRIVKLQRLNRPFDPTTLLAQWRSTAWPLPDEWTVPRQWPE
jgi:predicted DNA-binding transcriptional regulator YafY